jgi:hypothetical protein
MTSKLMGMTPIAYFESFVEGNLEDCRNVPDCVRRACNAAVAASHLADHYYSYNQKHNPDLVSQFKEPGAFVEHVSSQTAGAFRDIRSIANAYKHLYTDTNPRKPARSSVSSCGAIELLAFDHSDSDLQVLSQERVVFFTRKDGSRSEFLPVLERVVSHWRELLSESDS